MALTELEVNTFMALLAGDAQHTLLIAFFACYPDLAREETTVEQWAEKFLPWYRDNYVFGTLRRKQSEQEKLEK